MATAESTKYVPEDLTLLIGQACDAAEKFVNVFYERFDKQRHLAAKLYNDSATLVWDGNAVDGQQNIQKFHENLPQSSHVVDSFDSQPVASAAAGGQSTFLVMVSGSVKYEKNPMRIFCQTFILSAVSGTWKIVSDCYRTSD